MPSYKWTPAQRDYARERLTKFMIHKAHKVKRKLGFGYVESPFAPQSFAELCAEFAGSQMECKALPVYSEACDNTIYINKEGNWAFRYWHDTLHVMLDADYSQYGECIVAMRHLREIGDTFGYSSPEFLMVNADTLGQVEYYARNNRFPTNQLKFVESYCSFGPEIAVKHCI